MTDLSEKNDSTLHDLIPAYALGALSDSERTQVESLLATSAEAQAKLRVYEAMLTGMATLVPVRKAPANLTENFRARLASEADATAAPKVVPIGRRSRRLSTLAAIAAVLVMAIGVFALYRAVVLEAERSTIQAILKTKGAMWVNLSSPQGTPGKVSLVGFPTDPKAVLVAQLPPLPPEKQYQVWVVKGTERDSLLVFSIDQQAKQWLINMPDPMGRYDTIGITVEPAGGSPGPTSKPVFTGKISQ